MPKAIFRKKGATFSRKSFAQKIDKTYFDGNNFGPEGSIDKNYAWKHANITYNGLKIALMNAAVSIDPIFNQKWIGAVNNGLLEAVLEKKEQYNVVDSLNVLRSLSDSEKNSKHRLVQRVLSLLRYDFLNKENLSKKDIKLMYDDLNLIDSNILPDARQSAVANLISFCLYQDHARKIRIHFITSNKKAKKSELPHGHYGNSASVLLAGSLVNQHFSVFEAEQEKYADFGLYTILRTGFSGVHRRAAKALSFKTNINLELISSHLYRKGDHYFLPAFRTMASSSFINDSLGFHRVDTEDFAVTLFTQAIDNNMSYTTEPVGSPLIIHKKYELQTLKPKKPLEIILKIHQLVLKEL